MASLYRLLLLLSVIVTSVAACRSQRTKRGLHQLSGTIGCTTGRSSWAYWWYGCYCGLGGHGRPKDRTDWCCYQHDRCFGIAENYGCYPKLTWYQWTCEDGTAKCGHMTEPCGRLVCYCDTKFANCLKNAHYSYDYVRWPGYLCGY